MEIRKRLRAFTLVELLIVITIIGILAVALVPRITSAPEKARDAQRKADLQQIATALELYADDHTGSYPATGANTCVSDITDLSSYLTTVPEDPQHSTATSCLYTVEDADYGYYKTSDGYILYAGLESDTAVGDGIYAGFSLSGSGTTAATMTGTLCPEGAACTDRTYYLQR